MKLTFRPMPLWLGPETPARNRRGRYTFSAPWSETLNLLMRELRYLGAREGVVEADFTESDIRLDGLPRSNAKAPTHPGIRVAFNSKHGPLIYQTDSCAFWQHNVRSIALGLEALRAVDRYGITHKAEQYAGWKALPAGETGELESFDVDTAAKILLNASLEAQWPVNPEGMRRVIKLARRNAHPDRNGGDRIQWDAVDRASRWITDYFNLEG